MYLTHEESAGHPSERNWGGLHIIQVHTDQTMEKKERRLTEKLIQKDLDAEQPSLLAFSAQRSGV